MRMLRYQPRHLKRRPVSRGPAAVGAATAVWMAGSQAAHAGTHMVSSGETLSGIAARYGTTVAALVRANHLPDPNLIITGQRIRMPVAATMTSSHVVETGETLSGIATRYGTSVRALARANHLSNPNFIVAGASLRVPNGAGTSTPAASAPQGAPPATVEASIERHAANHGVDSSLVKAMAWQESGWQQDVVSEAGAIGVMQVMPATARFVNGVLGEGNLDVRAADDNVHLGVRYLKHLLESMPSEREAVAAYLAGPGNIGRKLTAEQRHYVRAVEAHRTRYR
ncbi:MAG: lytic transglycosylase domain-containing protein [Actinomycetota bacterium]